MGLEECSPKSRAFQEVLVIKNLPACTSATKETWVLSLGLGDPLEDGIAAHSSVPAWSIPWREKPGGLYTPWGHRVGHD